MVFIEGIGGVVAGLLFACMFVYILEKNGLL